MDEKRRARQTSSKFVKIRGGRPSSEGSKSSINNGKIIRRHEKESVQQRRSSNKRHPFRCLQDLRICATTLC